MENKHKDVFHGQASCPGPSLCDARHIRDLDTLALIAKTLATRTDQHRMLRDVLGLLGRRRGMIHCTIMLLAPDGKKLVLEAESTGEADGKVSYLPGEGVTGRVLESGETIIVPLVSHEPRFQFRVHRRPSGEQREVSFICVPIRLENEVIGTLSADHAAQSASLLKETAQLLELVASLIANDVSARRIARIERETLEAENQRLLTQLQEKFCPANMVGDSSEMRGVFARVHQVASADTTVLIRGESGTGKELIASAIHFNSLRSEKPFIKVNCSALNEALLESELFGHEKGAFTGALYKRIGRLEEAEGGTLFLDELGDFSPAIQVKLLRVIQEREYERVGSNKTIKADVRIVAATNRDLEAMVRDGKFRDDLYYRINVFPIVLPALRERRSDILTLANHFVEVYAKQLGHPIRRISTSAINLLMSYHWPGNVRELENCIEHAVLLCNEGVIYGRHLPPTLQTPTTADREASGGLKKQVAMLERDLIIDALKRHRGNISAASRDLGITGRMVRYKIENLDIDYDRFFKAKSRKSRR
ncbi:MAG: sigma-54 interaction domain-containing protein [Kiritimatiellales bacterium]